MSNLKGRGTSLTTANRFERIEMADDHEHLDPSDESESPPPSVRTEYFADQTGSIISENNSPDIPFRYSINPYRGCSHGCSYCYARPGHEYLGMNAGIDFESKILVKPNAAQLFRAWLARPRWKPEAIVFSGVTDCYQPAERQFRLTRQCLEVAWECKQPVSLITKNGLITRDLDLLQSLARLRLVTVAISITSLDQSLTRVMEPRTSAPAARLRALRELAQAGVPTQVMVAPIIPGLNEHEIPQVLKAASEAGAKFANYVMLRLPFHVETVFIDWLRRERPLQAERVLSRLRQVRDGKLSSSQFGERQRGSGFLGKQIGETFKLFAKRYGLTGTPEPLNCELFERPVGDPRQMRLF